MDYLDLCRSFVAANFPNPEIAVLGGSTARGTRTPTSDIDLLLVGDNLFTDGRTSLAGTYEYGGEAVEVFGYTHESFEPWARRGVERHRPVIVEMLIVGTEIRGGAQLEKLRQTWGEILAAGPAVTVRELEMRRYVLTDLLDDLRDSSDRLEQHVLASALFEKAAELILLTNGRWIGTGKYLPRRLRQLSVEVADQLSAPLLRGDLREFGDEVERWLEHAGGRVHTGFVR